jgi:hypothetical protein|tara:strand:- start:135 stop:344 length:210 start_codon:yes stop_codon:yes gene_type:complete
MSVKEKLLAGDSSLTGLNGAVPEVADQQLSTLHNEYSLNGRPNKNNLPNPTSLAYKVKEDRKYLNNLPK